VTRAREGFAAHSRRSEIFNQLTCKDRLHARNFAHRHRCRYCRFALAAILYVALTKNLFLALREYWAGMRPFAVRDTVSWNKGNYLIMERSGRLFSYRYRLLDVSGGNPWLLPGISSNPELPDGTPFWYAGKNGRCCLKKTGHPRLEFRISSSSRS
jgi:hypothetical protein